MHFRGNKQLTNQMSSFCCKSSLILCKVYTLFIVPSRSLTNINRSEDPVSAKMCQNTMCCNITYVPKTKKFPFTSCFYVFFLIAFWPCVCAHTHGPQCICEGQKTTWRLCSHSTIWDQWVKLKLSGLTASIFTYYSAFGLSKTSLWSSSWPGTHYMA